LTKNHFQVSLASNDLFGRADSTTQQFKDKYAHKNQDDNAYESPCEGVECDSYPLVFCTVTSEPVSEHDHEKADGAKDAINDRLLNPDLSCGDSNYQSRDKNTGDNSFESLVQWRTGACAIPLLATELFYIWFPDKIPWPFPVGITPPTTSIR